MIFIDYMQKQKIILNIKSTFQTKILLSKKKNKIKKTASCGYSRWNVTHWIMFSGHIWIGEKLVITILTLIDVAITMVVTKKYTDIKESNQDKVLVWH